MTHYGCGAGPGRITGDLDDSVVTDSEAIEIAQHLQIMLQGEWARSRRKGEVPEVEVVRVLWRGEGREVGGAEKMKAKGQGA